MKQFLKLTLILLILTGCSGVRNQDISDTNSTEVASVAISNPASIFCVQSGNKLEIRTYTNGSQGGVCLLDDGSSCEEWAYFRGECGPESKSPTPALTDFADASTNEGDQGENESGSHAFSGTTGVVAEWKGTIKSLEFGAQFDDYFECQDEGQMVSFGIDSINPEVRSEIQALRDSGKIVHIFGVLLYDVPDHNGSQIQVDRIEVE